MEKFRGEMMGRVILAALFALALLLGQAYAALSVEAYTVAPSTLKPGEEGAVTFSVKNAIPTGSTSVSPLESVQVFFGGTATGLEFKAQSPFVIGTIDSGGSALVSVPFRVLPNAKGGVISAPFFISQKDKTDLKTVNAVIRVVNPPILSLSSDHQTVLSTDTINLTISNNGGRADRVTLSLADGSGFAFVGTTEMYVGDIAGQKSIVVPLDARNAAEGVSSIPFVLTYQQEGGDTATEQKALSVAVKKEKSDVVFTQAGKLVSAQNGVLSLRLRNTGRQLEDFQVYLDDAKIKANENKQVKLGNLAVGAEKTLEYPVFVDASPGTQSVTLRLKWFEDDVEKEEVATVPVVVTSDADAAIFVDAKPAPIVAGGDHTLSITISNVGSYKIQNVEVELGQTKDFEIFNAQRAQYIGGLDADDFSSVQYKVRVNALMPGSYPLTVKVKYKDQSGAWVDKEQTIDISVRSPEDAMPKGSNGSLPIMLGGAAVLLAAGYWYFRMRKPGKPSASEKSR
jgi:hypothetical protein